MKKLLILLIAAAMCMTFMTACSNSDSGNDTGDTTTTVDTTDDSGNTGDTETETKDETQQETEESEGYDLELAQKLVDANVFSEDLEEIDLDMASVLYGVDVNTLTEVKAFHSAGASAEEVAVLVFQDEDSAVQAAKAMKLYLDGRITSYEDYLPEEVPKLENALLDQKGSTVLLLVCNDMTTAKTVIG